MYSLNAKDILQNSFGSKKSHMSAYTRWRPELQDISETQAAS